MITGLSTEYLYLENYVRSLKYEYITQPNSGHSYVHFVMKTMKNLSAVLVEVNKLILVRPLSNMQ